MEPEDTASPPKVTFSRPFTMDGGDSGLTPAGDDPTPHAPNRIRWVFMGPQGLRAGWSVAIFLVLFGPYTLRMVPHVAEAAPEQGVGASPWPIAFGEWLGVAFLLLVVWLMSLIERRKLLAYNLSGPRKLSHFAQGMGCGFLALSVLVGALAAGGWLRFDGMELSGWQIAMDAAGWGAMFFLVGCMEEGIFRCYLQFTLTRGVNFWWALVLVGAICGDLVWKGTGEGIWGVYAMAALGLLPCLWLYLTGRPGNGFWQAAWVTSTLFGFVHTGNNGENWIGIFAAAGIGAVFCVSIRVTGSAWWAIGCHAAWDWAQTYFYGVADSGFRASGHLLTTSPAGPALWSGGTDGPEGSVLVIPVVLLILVVLIFLYGKGKTTVAAPAASGG